MRIQWSATVFAYRGHVEARRSASPGKADPVPALKRGNRPVNGCDRWSACLCAQVQSYVDEHVFLASDEGSFACFVEQSADVDVVEGRCVFGMT